MMSLEQQQCAQSVLFSSALSVTNCSDTILQILCSGQGVLLQQYLEYLTVTIKCVYFILVINLACSFFQECIIEVACMRIMCGLAHTNFSNDASCR